MTTSTKQARIENVIRVHGTHNKTMKQLAAYANVSTKTLVVRISKLNAKFNMIYKINDDRKVTVRFA